MQCFLVAKSHNTMILSSPPLAKSLPFALKATERTLFLCALRLLKNTNFPVFSSIRDLGGVSSSVSAVS